jgi:exodeoxyribonuclease VII large subunit
MLARPSGGTEFTVAALSEYLRAKVAGDDLLRRVRVRGEVTNYKGFVRGGVMYFDLKEGEALVKCVAFSKDNFRFPEFGAGAVVVASGSVGTYRSTFQITVDHVEIAGVGNVHALFEQRKKKLAAEGLFDANRKRKLPPFPFRIALVSSKGAAGAGDFVNLLRSGRPHVEVVWCEATMQGPRAPSDIAGALGRASRLDVDAIVLTRGGGSFEDLFVFSEESIVRAVVNARHPVVSAIGHNIDQQLSDLAADVYAPTPSRAAELIGPETARLRERVGTAFERARRSAQSTLAQQRALLASALVRSRLSNPSAMFAPQLQRLAEADAGLADELARLVRQRQDRLAGLEQALRRFDPSVRLEQRARVLDGLNARLRAGATARYANAKLRLDEALPRLSPSVAAVLQRAAQRWELARTQLAGSDPETILQKGYAMVTLDGAIVKDPATVPLGATIAARVARGTLSARVEAKESNAN